MSDFDWESIVLLEEKWELEGYGDGRAEGMRLGYHDAYHLGLEKGRELGTEFGMMLAWMAEHEDLWLQTAKLKSTALQVRNAIAGFPWDDAKSDAMSVQMERIRAKMKMLKAGTLSAMFKAKKDAVETSMK